MKKVIVGHSSKGGEICGDYDQCKACNFCIHFMGLGLHFFSGKCILREIDLGYSNYGREAKVCESFEYRPELIRDEEV